MKAWQIALPIGLAAAAAAAVAIISGKKNAEKPSAPAKGGAKKAEIKNAKTGVYSFVSGFSDASTVDVSVKYDGDKQSFDVIGEEFLTYSSDSHVAAIYGDRTSGLSNVADITTTAVEEIGNSSTTVVALTGKIVVKCPKAADVAVYNAAGALVAVGNGRDNYTISVASGYYIVKVGNETFKRIVK